jgi:hypothetical protein
MLSGKNNEMTFSQFSSILSAGNNKIAASSYKDRVRFSSIISGENNIIGTCSAHSAIIAGEKNELQTCACSTSIIASYCSKIDCTKRAAIIGGCCNSMFKADNSIILGGKSLTLNNCQDVVYMQSMMTATISNPTASRWKLGDVMTCGVKLDSTQYVEVQINNTTYKLALVISA